MFGFLKRPEKDRLVLHLDYDACGRHAKDLQLLVPDLERPWPNSTDYLRLVFDYQVTTDEAYLDRLDAVLRIMSDPEVRQFGGRRLLEYRARILAAAERFASLQLA